METFDYLIVAPARPDSVLPTVSSKMQHLHLRSRSRSRDWPPYKPLPLLLHQTFHMNSITGPINSPARTLAAADLCPPRGKRRSAVLPRQRPLYNRGRARISILGASIGSRLGLSGPCGRISQRLERRVGEAMTPIRVREGISPSPTMDWRDPLCEAFMSVAHQSLGIPRNPLSTRHQEGVS